MIYVLIAIIATILAIPISKRKNLINRILFLLSFLVALLPMGLRYGIGTDYFYTYVPYFNWIGKGVKEFDELGFNFLNKIIYDTTGDYRVLFFITSFIFLVLIYKTIYNNSENICLSVLLIFIGQAYFYGMNIVRQSLAMAIILLSFNFLKKNNKIAYLLLGLLAFSIHSSAIILIPFLYLSRFNINTKKKLLILFLVVCCFPITSILIEKIIINTKYAWYYTNSNYHEAISNTVILENILVFIIDLLVTIKNKNKIDKEYQMLSNINFFGIVVMILSSTIPLINRLIRYFTIFQIIFIPKIINKISLVKDRIAIYLLIIIIMSSLTFYQIIIKGGEEVYPYVSIFGK